jgi:hypothetical protein
MSLSGDTPEEELNHRQLVLRGKAISEDESGLICLDDIWELSQTRETKAPKHWRTTRAARELIAAVQQKVTAGYLKNGLANRPVIYANRGRGAKGTYAHAIIAAAYAGYLSPKLEIEVREIWLRYRAGDASLADEILQRATAEANHRVGVRALARSGRNRYTDTLKAHGVEGKGYMECTEAVYLALLGGKSYEIRARMGLPAKSNLRDELGTTALASVMLAEALSAERIEEENRQGNSDCATASLRSARAVRAAVDQDRHNRRNVA